MLQPIFKICYCHSPHSSDITACYCKCLKNVFVLRYDENKYIKELFQGEYDTKPKIIDLSLRLCASGFIISLYKDSNLHQNLSLELKI